MNIGKRIRQLRNDKNLTIKELAKKSKMDSKFLEGIETDKYDPPYSYILSICKGLDIHIQDMLNVPVEIKMVNKTEYAPQILLLIH